MTLAKNLPASLRATILVFLAVLCVCATAHSQNESAGNRDSVCIFTAYGLHTHYITDIRVEWRVLRDRVIQQDINNTFDKYLVFCSTDSMFSPESTDSLDAGNSDHIIFEKMNARPSYFIKVEAYRNGRRIAQSESYTLNVLMPDPPPWTPASFLLWVAESIGVFDGAVEAYVKSTIIGRLAFELIAMFLIIGCITWVVKTHRMLRATRIFLVDRKKQNECNKVNKLATSAGWLATNTSTLKDLVEERLTRKYFYGNIGFLEWRFMLERLVKKRHKSKKDFHDMPTVKILNSAVYAQKASKNLEESLEVRITAEEEDLRKRSFIDILWALGVTSPLVGLFGTVTGISQSFKSMQEGSARGIDMIQRLSGGIFEALYTTICGLIVGILFMLVYYYYSYKMDRIHDIWVTFAAEFLDRFKHGAPPPPASKSGSRRPPSGGGPSAETDKSVDNGT